MNKTSTNFQDLTNEQQKIITEFIKENFEEVSFINDKAFRSAYCLKQKFSRLHFYVTEEQFTCAMENAGFRSVKRRGNFFFNIGNKSKFFKIK